MFRLIWLWDSRELKKVRQYIKGKLNDSQIWGLFWGNDSPDLIFFHTFAGFGIWRCDSQIHLVFGQTTLIHNVGNVAGVVEQILCITKALHTYIHTYAYIGKMMSEIGKILSETAFFENNQLLTSFCRFWHHFMHLHQFLCIYICTCLDVELDELAACQLTQLRWPISPKPKKNAPFSLVWDHRIRLPKLR
jgi:hypothetical protein